MVLSFKNLKKKKRPEAKKYILYRKQRRTSSYKTSKWHNSILEGQHVPNSQKPVIRKAYECMIKD